MTHEILQNTPYGGEIHILTDAADLDALPVAGRELLTDRQLEQFRDFPGALLTLAETADVPYVAAWLRALAQAPECHLEVCLTTYVDPLVLVRYMVNDKWAPALSFQDTHDLPQKTLALLRRVYELVGRINFDGYGYAGGLICPPNPYPCFGEYDEWREEDMPDYAGFMSFYESWTGDLLLVNDEGQVGWWVHDNADKCRLIGSLETVLPALFTTLGENRPFEP